MDAVEGRSRELEVLEAVVEQRRGLALDDQFRQRSGSGVRATAAGRPVPCGSNTGGSRRRSRRSRPLPGRLLRHHVGQQRVGGDIEGHAEEDVGAALVQLAGQLAVGDIELEEGVAGRQLHLRHVGHVPGRDDHAARVRVVPDLVQHLADLVDVARRPAPASCATGSRRSGPARRSRRPIRPRSRRRFPSGRRCWSSRCRNQISSWMMDFRCTFLVVTSGKPSCRLKRIWCRTPTRVPVPVRSVLRAPCSFTWRMKSRYWRIGNKARDGNALF
jgi:hypothetical protein